MSIFLRIGPLLPAARVQKRLIVSVKIALSIGILVYLGRNLDFAALLDGLKNIKVEFFAVGIGQLLFIPVLGAARWEIVLRCLGYVRRLVPLGRIFWIGMALNQLLPTAVGGDAVRTWMIYRDGVRGVDATVSVLLDRVVLLGSLLVMVSLSGWAGSEFVPPALFRLTEFAVLAALVGIAMLPFGERIFAALPDHGAARLVHQVWSGLSKVVMNYRVIPLALLCLLTNLNLTFAAWWLGQALDLPFGPAVYLVVIPVVTLATVIPISVGGWGVREAATVGLLGPLVGDERALLYSITFGIALLASSLPGLVLMMWSPSVPANAEDRDLQDCGVRDGDSTKSRSGTT